MEKQYSEVLKIREFNRFYTNILGLLNQGILNTEYSLTEARVLIEISERRECTANNLIRELYIDKGYISRILKNFENKNLIKKEKSFEDKRFTILKLTPKGKEVLEELQKKSNLQIFKLIQDLSFIEKEKLMKSMKTIESLLKIEEKNVIIRDYTSEDLNYIIKKHKDIYSEEYGFSSIFGDYVEKYIRKFEKVHDENKENIWIAECDGKIAGAIALVKGEESFSAQLRWFLVDPRFRRNGIGKMLIRKLLDFAKNKGYQNIFLWTVDSLKTARRIYKTFGFEIKETSINTDWTTGKVVEERWELML